MTQQMLLENGLWIGSSLGDRIAWIVDNVVAPAEGWNAVECLRALREEGLVNEFTTVIDVADEAKKLGLRK